MSVAPNSPNARAKLNIPPEIIDLSASGIETNINNWNLFAQSTFNAVGILIFRGCQ